MFSIGEHLIHPGQGVCTVTGFKDTPTPMLILEAGSGHKKTQLMYPVAQSDRLHPAISREAAEELIDHYNDLECDDFTERNANLEETYFKQLIKHGAPDTVRVVKTMRHRIRSAGEHSRKPSSYYARVLKEARRRSLEELACALECTEEHVEELLEAQVAASEN